MSGAEAKITRNQMWRELLTLVACVGISYVVCAVAVLPQAAYFENKGVYLEFCSVFFAAFLLLGAVWLLRRRTIRTWRHFGFGAAAGVLSTAIAYLAATVCFLERTDPLLKSLQLDPVGTTAIILGYSIISLGWLWGAGVMAVIAKFGKLTSNA